MVGKVVPYMVVGYVQVTIALLVGVLVFGVPVRGSLTALYVMAFFYIFCYLGLGLLISTVARSQQQAMQMSFFIFLPTILLSGFMFPRAGMPEFAQWRGLVIPLTYFLEILRGIILKGVPLSLLIRFIVPMVALMALLLQPGRPPLPPPHGLTGFNLARASASRGLLKRGKLQLQQPALHQWRYLS